MLGVFYRVRVVSASSSRLLAGWFHKNPQEALACPDRPDLRRLLAVDFSSGMLGRNVNARDVASRLGWQLFCGTIS